ncbi:MAG: cysteine hydrolase family protein [Acidimicrobiales bacterium]
MSQSSDRTALVVVDMQHDFCSADGYYRRDVGRPAVDEVVSPIRRLADGFRSAGQPVCFTRLVYDGLERMPERSHQVVPPAWSSSGPRLQRGSRGAEVIEELRPAPGDRIVDKAGYSAFYGTDLEQWLRAESVGRVAVTGVVAYACVLHTAFDAFVRGFDVVLVEDAVAGWEPELVVAASAIVTRLLGRTTTTDELLGELPAVDVAS